MFESIDPGANNSDYVEDVVIKNTLATMYAGTQSRWTKRLMCTYSQCRSWLRHGMYSLGRPVLI